VWTATALCATLGLLAPGAIATAVARTNDRPSVPTGDGVATVAVRPGSIVFGCCDPASFDGTTRGGRADWTSWTRTSAVGVGAVWIDPCKPSCAEDGYVPYPATLRLSDPRRLGHHVVFTHMTVKYTTSKRANWLSNVTVAYKVFDGAPDYYFKIG
jgi:hypothetical protein